MQQDVVIVDVDLAKNVCPVQGIGVDGKVLVRARFGLKPSGTDPDVAVCDG